MSEIRSVSVHLDADVSSYVAKMKLAGAATDQAFSSSSRSIDTTNRSLATTDTELRKVDSSARKVESSVRRLDSAFLGGTRGISQVSSKLDGFIGKLGVIPALAIAAGSALIPLAGAAAGVVAAFAAPLAFAGGGLTLFAILGGLAVKKTNEQLKSIDTLKKSMDSAQQSLENSRRSAGKNAATSASVANAQIKVNQATAAYHQALSDLSPAQRAYADSLDHLEGAFQKFIGGKSGQELIGPIAQALDLAATLLPKTEPIISAVSGGLSTLLDDLDRFSQTNEFSAFVHDVSKQIGPDLVIFGHVLGGFTHGLGDLLLLTGKKLSPELLHGLEDLAGRFSDFASSKGARQDVRDFVAYFHEVGPDAASTIGSIAHALARTVEALAPLGPPTLHVIQGIADAISSIPTPVLTSLASAAVGLVAFQKVGGFKVLSAAGITGGGGPLGGAGGLIGSSRPVPVFVTNPGFGTPGAPGTKGGPGVLATGAAATEAEAAAAAKAAAAGAAVKAAGGTGAEIAAATGKAFKEGMAAAEVAGEAAFIRGMPAFAKIAGASGLLRAAFGAPAFLSSFPDAKPDIQTRPDGSLPTHIPRSASLTKDLKSVGTGMDSLHAQVAKASHELDLIGPHAEDAFGHAAHSVTGLSDKINTIKSAQANKQFDLLDHTAAASLGHAGGQVDGFKGKLNSIPSEKQVHVAADTGQALHAIQSVNSAIAGIDRVVNVHVQVTRSTNALLADVNTPKGHAGGGHITGPGGPTSDSIPAWLSNGEYVMRAAAVRHYGLGAMDAMNAGHYASGGLATHVTSTPAGSHMTDGVRHELHNLQLSLHDATKELDKERAARQNLIQQRAQLSSTVRDNFRNDIFAPQTPWGMAAGPLGVLRTDIKQGRQYDRIIGRLGRRGLSGGALGEITTLADAQQVARMSPGQLRQLERLYGVRQRVSGRAGADLGDARFGKQIAEQTKVVKEQAADVHRLNQQIAEANKHLAAIKKAQEHHAADHAKALNNATGTGTRRARKT